MEHVVGRMGACVLLKVRHERLGRRFLLKYLSPRASSKAFAAERFLKTARAAMGLKSENAARTLDAGCLDSGLPFLVTEAFQGSELRDILRVRGALDPTEAIDFVLQAAHALAEAHRHGLAHGSLSPSTLFVTPGADGLPLIKVLEFGCSATLRDDVLATRLRRWTQGTAIFGESKQLWDTLAYSAPEQLRGLAEPTPAVDVWALGAVLYETLTGAPPFSAPNAPALMAAIVADRPVAPRALSSGLPRKLEALVLRCLARSPEARFQSVSDFAAALRPFASPERRVTVDRIGRIQAYDPQQASWSSSLPAPGRRGPSSQAAIARWPAARIFARSLAQWRPLLLATLGALIGALAGTYAAKRVATLAADPNPPLTSSAKASRQYVGR